MNTARKGNVKEVKSAQLFEADGWMVASRRHIGGVADLLCVRPIDVIGFREYEVMLVEVKCRKNVWEGFRRADRAALLEEAERIGAKAVLAWWKPRARTHELMSPETWPA